MSFSRSASVSESVLVADVAGYSLPYDTAWCRRVAARRRVRFVCHDAPWGGGCFASLRDANVDIVKLPDHGGSGTGKALALLRFYRSLPELMQGYGHLHLMWPTLPLLDLVGLARHRQRLILSIHNAQPHDASFARSTGLSRLMRRADVIVYPSTFTRSRSDTLHGSHAQARVVPHGLLPAREHPVANVAKAYRTPDRRELVFWGQIRTYKGVEDLIAAVDLLGKHGYRLRIDGKWQEDLWQRCSRMDGFDRVFVRNRFLSDEELDELLSLEATFVLPYRSASQSGVLYTLLMHRRWFVASDVGDTAVVLRSAGLERLLFRPGDLHGLVAALRYLENNRPFVARMLEEERERRQWSACLDETVLDELYPASPGE